MSTEMFGFWSYHPKCAWYLIAEAKQGQVWWVLVGSNFSRSPMKVKRAKLPNPKWQVSELRTLGYHKFQGEDNKKGQGS